MAKSRRAYPATILCTLLLTGALWSLGSGSAAAHFSAAPYTHKNSCTVANRVDPVNLIFYDWATGSRSLNHIGHHGGWTHTDGSDQYFGSHAQCLFMSGQRANGSLTSSRWHVRLRTTYDNDSTWGITAMGAAHRDERTGLCHSVPPDGFNRGRTQVVNMLAPSPHHTYSRNQYWGNTQAMKQCNGGTASSDGYVAWISMPDWNH